MHRYAAPVLLTGILALSAFSCSSPEKTWYEVEHSGVVLGYLTTWTEPHDSTSGEPIVNRGRMIERLTLLGQNMDVTVNGEERLDPATGRVIYTDMWVNTGPTLAGATCVFEGDTLRYTTKPGGETQSFYLTPDILMAGSLEYPYLVDLKPGEDAISKKFLDTLRGKTYERSFTPVDTETLLVAGAAYPCMVVDTYNESAGVATRLWVELGTGRFIRESSSDGSSMTLSDEGVRRRVQRTNMDDMILAKVNVEIDDIRAITAMKVRAKVRTVGQRVTPESLNVPGQRFEGTVERNFIDGVFEIRHAKYDGSTPPPFPPPPADDDMQRYLEPELAIECNHPDIVEKAKELTEGATDSWDASRRIAHFVGTEIGGAIPGGGSALGTLREGEAECGGHSRLYAALCRAVGIPVRTVMGCMYSGVQGGTFGQHMWNEVYMGEDAGWVPIDATARELDYVDSGHIRLGTLTSFNPQEMEVLEYEVGDPVPDPLEDGE
jgi:hypothetical protein